MNLIIDIGNSFAKLVLYKGDKIVKQIKWDRWGVRKFSAFYNKHQPDAVCMSSTQPVADNIKAFFKKKCFFIFLSEKTPIPIKNKYRTPKTLGKDRLAAVIGAYYLYPKKSCLVIDAGTCITYDLLTKKGEYLGGNISPGIDLRLRAMDEFTAKLPLVKRKELKKNYGIDTESALLVGGQNGTVHEMQGFIHEYQHIYGPINVILTGGAAKYFAKKLKTKIFVHPTLVPYGLNQILKYNVSKK